MISLILIRVKITEQIYTKSNRFNSYNFHIKTFIFFFIFLGKHNILRCYQVEMKNYEK